MRDQEAAVQQTIHLERSSLFYLSALIVHVSLVPRSSSTLTCRTQKLLLLTASDRVWKAWEQGWVLVVFCTQLHQIRTLKLAL